MTESAKTIGGFRVLKDLKAGAGSQGTVYQAVCEKPCFPGLTAGTVVALKVMAVQDDDGEAFARLEKRTDELVKLNHPNVVKYYGCFREPGPFNDLHVIVLEFVEGRSLKELLVDSPCGLGADESMRIAFGLIDGLSHTSSQGIVHRDIKPGNVIVQPDGTPKLIDFEVARREGGTVTVGGGNMIGTFDYMAPDFTDADFRGDVVSDVFSMGVVLHEMLTGSTPYRRQSGTSSQANVAFLQRWLKAGTARNPLRVSGRVGKILPGCRDLLERALSPEREHRIQDFPAFREALSKVRFREFSHRGSHWRLLNYIGHGGFGEVFRAADLATGEHVAVKHLLNAAGFERFRREANAMRRVSGSCFPKFVDWFQTDDGDAFLVMEYLDGMPGESLKDHLKTSHGSGFDRVTVLKAFARYARGLSDLHALGLIHRDIKPANLYLPLDAPDRAAIMDLGIARDVSGTATVGQVPGTIDYMPPECVTGQTRGGPEADVWALGLCLCEALSGKTAYPRLPEGQAAFEAYFRRVNKGEKPDFSVINDAEVRSLLTEMCMIDPKKRLRDLRLVERRLRILSGENPDNLPVPETDFVWQEASGDADFGDAVDTESISGVTLATAWGGNSDLARARSEFANRQHRRRRRKVLALVLPLLLALVVGGGYAVWHFAEKRRDAELAAAAERAQRAAEAAQKREAALRHEREEADRRAAIAKQEAESAAKKVADEAAAKARAEAAAKKAAEEAKKAEAEAKKAEADARRAAEKAEADRKAREKQEADRKAAEQQAEAERIKAEKAVAEAKAKQAEAEAKKQESERQAREQKAAEAKAREAAEKAKKAEIERLEKERLAREVDEEAEQELKAKLKKLDDEFAACTLEYQKQLDDALKPGSTLDPEKIQQNYLLKRKSYKAARKKLLEKKR